MRIYLSKCSYIIILNILNLITDYRLKRAAYLNLYRPKEDSVNKSLLLIVLTFLVFNISCKKNPTSSENTNGTANTAPIASFVINPTSGTIDTVFDFDATGSSDNEDATTVLQVRWDWDNDGVWDTDYSTTKTATHQYSTVGTYTVKLEVKDSAGLTNTTTKTVSITNTANAQFSLLYSFTGSNSDGYRPHGSLISDGTYIYGMTLSSIFRIGLDGSNFSLLHNFTHEQTNGGAPYGSLISDGTYLYGMTFYGGADGEGTIFRIGIDGNNFELLHSFSEDTQNGENPNGSLISDGTYLYGMTEKGGKNSVGIIFRIEIDGNNFEQLHSFAGNIAVNGYYPYGSLISDGTYLYGMTEKGGVNSGKGTIFRIRTNGNEFALLRSFGGINNGSRPHGSLISDGTYLFGMTQSGGKYERGTIFRIGIDGGGFTLLHSFEVTSTNGAYPYGSLIRYGTNLYGMTSNGGSGTAGTIFKIGVNGSGFEILHNFYYYWNNNGAVPRGSLLKEGTAVYGMTRDGGITNDLGYGTIFKLSDPSLL